MLSKATWTIIEPVGANSESFISVPDCTNETQDASIMNTSTEAVVGDFSANLSDVRSQEITDPNLDSCSQEVMVNNSQDITNIPDSSFVSTPVLPDTGLQEITAQISDVCSQEVTNTVVSQLIPVSQVESDSNLQDGTDQILHEVVSPVSELTTSHQIGNKDNSLLVPGTQVSTVTCSQK